MSFLVSDVIQDMQPLKVKRTAWNKGKKGFFKHTEEFKLALKERNKNGLSRYTARARVNVQNAIKRELDSKEIVHHINKDTLNDNLENLYLFRHHAAHKRWHLFLRRHDLADQILVSNILEETI